MPPLQVPCILYHGSQAEREVLREKLEDVTTCEELDGKEMMNVVVTSYEIAMNDRASFQHIMWRYIVWSGSVTSVTEGTFNRLRFWIFTLQPLHYSMCFQMADKRLAGRKVVREEEVPLEEEDFSEDYSEDDSESESELR